MEGCGRPFRNDLPLPTHKLICLWELGKPSRKRCAVLFDMWAEGHFTGDQLERILFSPVRGTVEIPNAEATLRTHQ